MKFYVVEAFCGPGAQGNPAGVAVLQEPANERWMQRCASLLNCSETAYLIPSRKFWKLRWFTPACEVDLCGHATLAAAHVLGRTCAPGDNAFRFKTRSGLLMARQRGTVIELDFPAQKISPLASDGNLLEVMGLEEAVEFFKAREDALLVLSSEQEVRQLQPDFEGLLKLSYRAVMVTAPAKAGSPFDFVSRFFAPRLGISEDPVTGSAHCVLGPYWAKVLRKSELSAFQASDRGGILQLTVRPRRVILSGVARTVQVRHLEGL